MGYFTPLSLSASGYKCYTTQNNLSVEHYVEEYCELCYLEAFNDVAPKDIFCEGLDETMASLILANTIHWTLTQYTVSTLN